MQDLNKIVAAQLHSEGKDLFDVVAELEELKQRHDRLVEAAKAYYAAMKALRAALEENDGQ